jgi:hypothetical protein
MPAARNNWAAAELALCEANAIYEQIILHFSESAPRLALRAQQQKDFTTWYLAVVTATIKNDLTLTVAEQALLVLSGDGIARRAYIDVYTIGLRAAIALDNEVQGQVWQQRLDDLTPSRAGAAEGSARPTAVQVPQP